MIGSDGQALDELEDDEEVLEELLVEDEELVLEDDETEEDELLLEALDDEALEELEVSDVLLSEELEDRLASELDEGEELLEETEDLSSLLEMREEERLSEVEENRLENELELDENSQADKVMRRQMKGTIFLFIFGYRIHSMLFAKTLPRQHAFDKKKTEPRGFGYSF